MLLDPIIELHHGIHVVRDDLLPGGTKSRYFLGLFEEHDHVVYASPGEGGAQTALAWAAREAGKRCTIFTAERKVPHPRAHAAKRLGADVVLVAHGYLNVVQSKAAKFCERTGAFNLPFGGAIVSAEPSIVAAAHTLPIVPDEVWCAAGSGTLAKALMRAWPDADMHAVEVGRKLPLLMHQASRNGAYRKHEPGMAFAKPSRVPCPFPSDPHYDRKAWGLCAEKCSRDGRTVLMWNVAGPAEEIEP